MLIRQQWEFTMRSNKLGFLSVSAIILLAGCQQPGADLGANVYDASQVNQNQNAKVIDIVTIAPAQIKVSNAQNQKTAEVAGSILGAVGGGLLGNSLSGGMVRGSNTVGGAALGGIAGAAAGSLVSSTALVDGVTIGYNEDGSIHTSTQVGEMCQFKQGRALVVMTQENETRVQPNTDCQKPTNNG
jgi:outer membrane lipoprotein SlyB